MRSLMLATLIGTGQSLSVANKSKKPAVQALMESAAHMLKNGATPEVVTFAETTLDEVTGTVMPAIISESENDQLFINNLHARFAVIEAELVAQNERINALNLEEKTKAGEHETCRNEEQMKCYGCGSFTVPDIEECPSKEGDLSYGEGKRPCEMNLYSRWENWVSAENHLRDYHDHIEGLFCPGDANGTTKVFREDAKAYMEEWMRCKGDVDETLREYDLKEECCQAAHEALDKKSEECNELQGELEAKACQHANLIHTTLSNFYRDYAQAESAYNCAEEEVRQLEADRKKEWVTLEVVRCLLSRIRAQNGVPCDESTNQVTEEIGFCEQRHNIDVCTLNNTYMTDFDRSTGIHRDTGHSAEETFGNYSDVFHRQVWDPATGQMRNIEDHEALNSDVTWSMSDVMKLCINYPDVPAIPDFCSCRDSVNGVCLPPMIPTPCTSRWEHYEGLPDFPQPPFSSTNPGCNAWECDPTCEQPSTPEYVAIDTCPGYTVDGCDRDGDGDENPLTYIRSVDGVADVRCCSGDDECQSRDFDPLPAFGLSPVDFTTPDGGTHTNCYFDVTYQEAMHICHSAGKRICTVAEMNSNQCCGTGCWHNHHPIWVDAQGARAGVVQYQTHGQSLQDAPNRQGPQSAEELSGRAEGTPLRQTGDETQEYTVAHRDTIESID